MIKALIFDNNGVLTDTENDGIHKMAQLFRVDFNDFNEVWKEYAKPLDDGGITTEDFLAKVINHFDASVNIKDIKDIYFDCYPRNDEMHDYVKNLSQKFTVALLSNFGDSFDIFEKKWRTFDTIHPRNIFVSVKHKMRKPNREFYDLALNNLGIEPHEAIFIDDRQENIDAAESLGIKGILFKSPEQLKNELEYILEKDEK